MGRCPISLPVSQKREGKREDRCSVSLFHCFSTQGGKDGGVLSLSVSIFLYPCLSGCVERVREREGERKRGKDRGAILSFLKGSLGNQMEM